MTTKTMPRRLAPLLVAPLVIGVSVTHAQYDPASGQYGKLDPNHVRVMTWNVEDNLRTEEPKTEGFNEWTALARIVAALRPDVLLLQETGDNNCGGCVDSPAELANVVQLFFQGGTDPYLGGNVTAYVQKYAPGFDMPHVLVGTVTDGYNRQVIVSRLPFSDLNGDGVAAYGNAPQTSADAYAPGTFSKPIIRGLQLAEIDLPDATYPGDLVVLTKHLKAGSGSSNETQRSDAARNIAYLVDYWLNGAGTGTPDPNNKVNDVPAATQVLSPETVVVLGGDWNEDESTNGRKGPADWIVRAQLTGSNDGTDRDRSDALYEDARYPCDPSLRRTQSTSKLDYIGWQDSIATLANSFVFDSVTIKSMCASNYPPEFNGFIALPDQMSNLASDHRPVVVDLEVPVSIRVPTPPRSSSAGSRGTSSAGRSL